MYPTIRIDAAPGIGFYVTVEHAEGDKFRHFCRKQEDVHKYVDDMARLCRAEASAKMQQAAELQREARAAASVETALLAQYYTWLHTTPEHHTTQAGGDR